MIQRILLGTVICAGASNLFAQDPVFTTGPAKVTNPGLIDCGSGDELKSLSQLDLKRVPLLDAGGGEEFVAYIFADNYFELYVNGELLAVDPVPFTPFNSNVVRFTAERPLTIAVMMVDWEENLGLRRQHLASSFRLFK